MLAINSTDKNEFIERGGESRFVSENICQYPIPKYGKYEYFFASSHIVRALFIDILKLDYSLLTKEERIQRKIIAKTAFSTTLQNIKTLCKKKGILLSIIIHPVHKSEIANNISPIEKWIPKRLQDKNVEIINLVDYFNKKTGHGKIETKSFIWPIDSHFNAKGYKIFAEGILENSDILKRVF